MDYKGNILEHHYIDNLKDIRWKQRFENFEKAYKLLEKYSNHKAYNELEIAGIIHYYDMTFELSWKVLKDYLETQDFIVKSPRETIKQAFQVNLIENGHIWMDALSNRNLTVHTYDEILAKKITNEIIDLYFPELKKLYEKLLKEI